MNGMDFKVLVECMDGPMDGHRCMVNENETAFNERTFIFAHKIEGVLVAHAYKWNGRYTAAGMAMLGHVMEVGRGGNTPQTEEEKTEDRRKEEEKKSAVNGQQPTGREEEGGPK